VNANHGQITKKIKEEMNNNLKNPLEDLLANKNMQ
jgi:hypothetical protein